MTFVYEDKGLSLLCKREIYSEEQDGRAEPQLEQKEKGDPWDVFVLFKRLLNILKMIFRTG